MKKTKIKTTTTISYHKADTTTKLALPLMTSPISAGFPSPADDYVEQSIDLNKELIKNPSATFLGRVKGLSMQDAGIGNEDILVIDKSLEPAHGRIAVCFIDGEFTIKRIRVEKSGIYLMPANKDFQPIKITEDSDFMVWGIVTFVIKKV